MRAMILAAGRGERLRPLTDHIPKPLVKINGKPLIEYHLENLAEAGFEEIIINQGHLGEMLPRALGDGSRFNVRIHWSDELDQPLETGGGIFQALPLLGEDHFLVINGDIWTDYSLSRLKNLKSDWAHLVMVANPKHHPEGDFFLENGVISESGQIRYTFSGIAVYHPCLFRGCKAGKFSVVPLLKAAIKHQHVGGELHLGCWADTGSIERLEAIRNVLSKPANLDI